MPLTQLQVSGYRSIRRLTLPLKRINVLVGANGSGKSNLYRSLYLVCAAANGTLARTIAAEGGLPSALWAGKRTKTEEPKIRITVEIDEDTEYVLTFGRVPISERPGMMADFCNDLDIKQEQVTTINHRGKRTSLVQRRGRLTTMLDTDGRTANYPFSVAANESILSELREPHRFPELAELRQRFLACRFYHHFRVDADSPLRQPQVGILTPVMAHDGVDVACALATIMAMDGPATVHNAFEAAFPGARLIVNSEYGEFDLQVEMPGVDRPFQAIELSDGTLQYACLLAALLSPRPPELLAINEPEASMHEDLMEPLARLIVQASKKSQLWITTHSRPLAAAIAKYGKSESIELIKISGQTCISNREPEDDEEEDDASY
ncbi:MAG: AAA family ATPase [Candidatus Obscuribacterales bacterium]|nr:AAA family ATPase [Candidatus Obscuribacterales bacterium]